jgi:hypothetical protein
MELSASILATERLASRGSEGEGELDLNGRDDVRARVKSKTEGTAVQSPYVRVYGLSEGEGRSLRKYVDGRTARLVMQ